MGTPGRKARLPDCCVSPRINRGFELGVGGIPPVGNRPPTSLQGSLRAKILARGGQNRGIGVQRPSGSVNASHRGSAETSPAPSRRKGRALQKPCSCCSNEHRNEATERGEKIEIGLKAPLNELGSGSYSESLPFREEFGAFSVR